MPKTLSAWSMPRASPPFRRMIRTSTPAAIRSRRASASSFRPGLPAPSGNTFGIWTYWFWKYSVLFADWMSGTTCSP